MFARISFLVAWLCVAMVASFRPMINRRMVTITTTSSLHMSSVEEVGDSDPLEAIKNKIASDPSYDPLKDPQAMQALESMIPTEMREFANAVERLKVTFDDATTGQNPIEDLDSLKVQQDDTALNVLLSSPTSEWFKGGAPDETVNEDELKDALRDVQKEYPDIPMN